jgi:two-component system, OmpR family, phosphate regulon sensor histidine kinase PhoR
VVRSVVGVFQRRQAYVSLGYILLHFPLSFLYLTILGVGLGRGLLTFTDLLVLIPVGLAIWGVVAAERGMARDWFQARLTPMAPQRPPDRPWAQRVADFLSNPVTWKCLAYVALETPLGFIVGGFALMGTLIGVFGTVGSLLALVTVFVVALAIAPDSVPVAVPFVMIITTCASFAILLATLLLAPPVARAQVYLVRVMLGMSETQAALAAARAEAESQRTRAEVSDRSRRDLVLNVSHELRNPLATIKAHIDTLRGDEGVEPSEEERKRYLEVLGRETDRLSSLVEELLTLASADSGGLHLDIEPVDPQAVATQVHEAMAPLAWRERHIRLLYNAEPAESSVLADRSRLAQVMMNLVRNAITQTSEGGLVAIEVKPLQEGPVELSVSDTGPGIAPQDTDKIFERFYRTDSSRARSTGGFGLGLAIAREMVEAMGGRIRVESTPGQGSRFTVTLGRASGL